MNEMLRCVLDAGRSGLCSYFFRIVDDDSQLLRNIGTNLSNSCIRRQKVLSRSDELRVSFADGRWLSVPIVWFPRLAHATATQRANYELLGGGEGIHWPEIDEDVSVAGLIAGQPSVEFKAVHT